MNAAPPTLPETAPFTPEQRGWLNGYIAAMFPAGGTAPPPPAAEAPQPAPQLPPVTILWGSQTGNAEGLAKKAAKSLTNAGATATVFDMADYPQEELAAEENLLIITSTYGDGEPPDNAGDLLSFLLSEQAPKFDSANFAVFGLGDSEYPDFCECGKQLDARLEELGASRLLPRVDCDVDFDEPFAEWQKAVIANLQSNIAA